MEYLNRKTPMMTGKAGPKPSMREFCSMVNQDKDFNKVIFSIMILLLCGFKLLIIIEFVDRRK